MKILSLLVKVLEEETSNKIKIRSVDFEAMLYGGMGEEMAGLGNEFDEGEGYSGEEIADTMGELDEENDGKMLMEDFEAFGDTSSKMELKVKM